MENDPDDPMHPSKIFTIYKQGYKHEYIGESSRNGNLLSEINLYPEESNIYIKITLFIDKENAPDRNRLSYYFRIWN